MARVIEEELIGYGLTILAGERQQVGEDGQPVFNGGEGGPKTEQVWLFVFNHVGPEGRHTVKVTFTEQGKKQVVEALTGIQVATSMPAEPPSS